MPAKKRKDVPGVPALAPVALRRACDPATLSFETTDELPRLGAVIGQPRANRAFELGSDLHGGGFNIFVLGLPASGRTSLSREYLENKAGRLPAPDDWCYVNNFDDPHRPKALRLQAGRAGQLRQDMAQLVESAGREIKRAFKSEEYQREHKRLADSLQKRREDALSRLQAYAAAYNFLIVRTPFGFVLAPALEGRPFKPEELEKLAPDKLEKLKKLEVKVSAEVDTTLEKVREMERRTQEAIRELDERTTLFVVEHLVDEVQARYVRQEPVIAFLDDVQDDMVANVDDFRAEESASESLLPSRRSSWEVRYQVNVIVDNSGRQSAPVIVENQPSYHNLIGRIEHQVLMGASHTDFTQIRPGALHRANGGFLILPVRDVLLNPYAWDGLKRTLRESKIRIVELGNQLGLISTSTLEPEPIPLEITVVLIGTPLLYHLMRAHEEDFPKLFKVQAEFASRMDRTPETEHEYALFVRSVVEDGRLPPFDRQAIAGIIEHGSRLVADQGKLSTRFGKIADLVREAAYWAGKGGSEVVRGADVSRAIEEGVFRSNLVEERIQELIEQGVLLIDVSGQVAGQVNALSVLMLGDYAFGRPSRVTAVVSPGHGDVVDVESKSELGGSIHTKGVLILSGFLLGRFGRRKPLSLAASLTFEQSYEGVEGDSASMAELLALLSALAEIPLRQEIAVTGSINQHGAIQPIGGVNEKIEGFFAVCERLGLTGAQGVVIPAGNVRNLMLDRKVVEAAARGGFHIWPVATIDQAIRIFTGMEPGEPDKEGAYPAGSFNAAVLARLDSFAEAVRKTEKSVSENGG